MNMTRCFTVVGLSILVWTACVAAGGPITLETLRRRVANNEKLIDPIKLNYTVKLSRTGELPQSPRGGRGLGRSYSHYDVVWAQSGSRQYVQQEYFYGPNEPARNEVKILDGNLRTQASRPEHVSIEPVGRTDWYDNLTAKLRLRPFEDQRWLSEMLVPSYATLLDRTETIDGRSACVVDLTRAEFGASITRLWIDQDSGIPLRARVYTGHPDAPQSRLSLEVNDVTPYRLPNGGWIPISGTRAVHFTEFTGCDHITVDVNSITIRPEEIPDSLFRLVPPEGGTAYNAFTGLTTTRGRETRTYERIVAGDGTFVSGTVVDASGSPVSGTVVAPFSIKTSQKWKLIQPYERCCAVTDAQGRFALELEEEGRYDLEFYSAEFVDEQLRDVPLGEPDLRVVVEKGGAVTGRVFFVSGGRKLLVAGASVSARAGDSLIEGRMRYARRETSTDEQGRFEFKCLPTQMRDRSIATSEPPRYIPLPWRICCGSTSENVLFKGDGDRCEIEILLRSDICAAAPLVGRPLPELKGLGLDIAAEDITDRKLLLCFFDMEQRPARNCVEELARRAVSLKERGVTVLLVHEKSTEAAKLGAWAKEAGVAFPVGIMAGDPAEVKFAWAVRSLPWLILTDRDHKVAAEGFDVNELDEMIGGDTAQRP